MVKTTRHQQTCYLGRFYNCCNDRTQKTRKIQYKLKISACDWADGVSTSAIADCSNVADTWLSLCSASADTSVADIAGDAVIWSGDVVLHLKSSGSRTYITETQTFTLEERGIQDGRMVCSEAPNYLADLRVLVALTEDRQRLHSALSSYLMVPWTQDFYRSARLCCVLALDVNKLPEPLRSINMTTLQTFRCKLKAYLFQQ